MDMNQEVKDLIKNMLEDGNGREQLFDLDWVYEGDSEDYGDMFFHVDTYIKTRFWYTMGGPNVYVDVTSTPDGFIMGMKAVAEWGGSSWEQSIRKSDPLYDLIEQELECLLDAPEVTHF